MSSDSEDLTGQKRIGKNVSAAWLAQLPVIISGFFVPRLIDGQLDQATLGIWDFGWSTVAYLQFLGLGLAGGLHRYVAFYRARNDIGELRCAISSTSVLQFGVAIATLLISIIVGYVSQRLFADTSIELAGDARWLVILLGAGLAIKMVGWTGRGLLAGYHHWSTNFYLTATGDVLSLVAFVVVLMLGGGLIELGFAFMLTSLGVEGWRMASARAVHGEPMFVRKAIRFDMLKQILFFGIKTNIGVLPHLIVVQSVSLILAAVTGPAALAIYARPLALARHSQTLVAKFANILSSTAGSLHGLGEEESIRRFFLDNTRFAYAITIPQLLLLGLYGDLIVNVWMGSHYVDVAVAPILAAGMLAPYANAAAMQVLMGIDSHGLAGIASLIVSSVAMAIGIAVGFIVGWSPLVAAAIVGCSLTAGPGIAVLVVACRRLHILPSQYFKQALRKPLLLNLVFAAIIAVPRLHEPRDVVWESLAAIGFGGAVLAALYWRFLLAAETKAELLSKLLRRQARPS